MNVRWHGQSAFTLQSGDTRVTIDPFGDLGGFPGRDFVFDYPPVPAHDAELLLITHEHRDHNAAEAVTGDPVVIRATAGTIPSPIGEVVAVSSEHDSQAGTQRGPNTIFVFSLEGIRVAHFGDFGQEALRPEQRAAIGEVDLLFVPVGGGPTSDPDQAAEIVDGLSPRWVVPMHYRTESVNFLGPLEPFVDRYERVRRFGSPEFSIDPGARDGGLEVLVPSVPAKR